MDLRVEGILNRPRIIVADDHLDMLHAAVRLLKAGFEILTTAQDGNTALEAIIKLRPDVVVLDISMPVLTGIEVARRVKAFALEVRIVFLTVHEDLDFVREAFEAGGLAYVTKPRMANDLRFAIREALSGRSFVSPSMLNSKK